MGGLPDWSAYGTPALVWLVATINYLKENFGLETKYALPVAVAISAAIGTALYFGQMYKVVMDVTNIVLGAVLLGFAATGYYSGTKKNVETRNGSKTEE